MGWLYYFHKRTETFSKSHPRCEAVWQSILRIVHNDTLVYYTYSLDMSLDLSYILWKPITIRLNFRFSNFGHCCLDINRIFIAQILLPFRRLLASKSPTCLGSSLYVARNTSCIPYGPVQISISNLTRLFNYVWNNL